MKKHDMSPDRIVVRQKRPMGIGRSRVEISGAKADTPLPKKFATPSTLVALFTSNSLEMQAYEMLKQQDWPILLIKKSSGKIRES